DDRGVPAALLGEDDGVGVSARLDLGEERGARDLDRLRALRIGGGELGLIGVEEAVDDRRGEKLGGPLQQGVRPCGLEARQQSFRSFPRKRESRAADRGPWVRAISAFTRVHSPSKTGVNALIDALCAGTSGWLASAGALALS